ncbi:MAG: tetratricopeptide repeat protein [Alphaproteobacteria bacterium]
MRRFVLLLSAFVFVSAIGAAEAQTQQPAKRVSARQKAAQKPATPPPDTRPRFKRDDTQAAAPVAAAAGKPAAPTHKRRRGRKPADGAPPAAAGADAARSTPRDIAACAQTKDNDAAIAGCTRVIDDSRVKPKGRAAAYYNRGNASAAKGDSAAAIADYDEALKLEPKNARALANRGTAHSEKGDADAAIADFDEAIKRDPRLASAYFNRANAYAAKGETDRAITDYTAAIRYDRRNVNAYIARGALYLAGGAAPKARADMALAARLDRRNAYAVLWLDIAERRAKQKGVLARGTRGLDMKAWPAPVIRLFAGEMKQDAVLAAANDADVALKPAHTCEANFYGGQYALIEGQRDDAVKLFEAAAKDCPHGFLEGIAATAELKGLGQKVGAN